MWKNWLKLNIKTHLNKKENIDEFGLTNNIPDSTRMIKIEYNRWDWEYTSEIFKTKNQAIEFLKDMEKKDIKEIWIWIFDNDSIYIEDWSWNYEDNSNLVLEYKKIKDLSKINDNFWKMDTKNIKVDSLIKLNENKNKTWSITLENWESIDYDVTTREEKTSPILDINIILNDYNEDEHSIKKDTIIDVIKFHNYGIWTDKNIWVYETNNNNEVLLSQHWEYELQLILENWNEIELSLTVNIDYENDFANPINFEYELSSWDIELNWIDDDDFYDYIKDYIRNNLV